MERPFGSKAVPSGKSTPDDEEGCRDADDADATDAIDGRREDEEGRVGVALDIGGVPCVACECLGDSGGKGGSCDKVEVTSHQSCLTYIQKQLTSF